MHSRPESRTAPPSGHPGGGADLLTLLEAAAAGHGRVHFRSDDAPPVDIATLWQRSAAAARWFRGRAGGPVALLLTASEASLTTLVGAWRAGQTVVSLPMPSRGTDAGEYRAHLDRCCAVTGAEVVLCEDRYLGLLPGLRVGVLPYSACASASGPADAGPGELVQFTSGSTGAPKGVRLSMSALGANVLAVLDVLAPARGDVSCSWLPLSHDLGLVGMCLAPWAATAPGLADDGDLCLLRTEDFAADPGSWMRTCSAVGATVTAAPTFGYAVAAACLRRGVPRDLSRLRACIVGAEAVRPDVLRGFAAAAAPAGFDNRAFCPAYGLAEAAVAVTMHRPGTPFTSFTPDRVGRELVSCGAPVPGMEVRIGDAGTIAVRGDSLMSGYVPDRGDAVDADGWLTTHDSGFCRDGELYVVGREDDVLVVRGRKLSAVDVDLLVEGHPDVRVGAVATVTDPGGGYTVVLEIRGGSTAYRTLARDLDARIVTGLGIGPDAIAVAEPGTLPKTASGKVARHRVRDRLAAGSLPLAARIELRATP
ncbi:MAG TPA: AMP-binding protein [Mycobacteriales bacterium]|jgi:acyl-CoA synthetase (AMP-forming)/AMP-acid ligase II